MRIPSTYWRKNDTFIHLLLNPLFMEYVNLYNNDDLNEKINLLCVEKFSQK